MRKERCLFLKRLLKKKDGAKRNRDAVKDTKQMHSIDSKTYTKERHQLHKKIIRMLEKTDTYPKKGNKPVAILIGGGTASGKTTMRKTIVEKELKAKNISATTVDLDEIKEYIPEYAEYKKTNPNEAARFVHKESYDIGELLLKRLIKKRKNFIYESTMSRTRKYKSLVNKLKKHNYEIHAYVAYVPLSVAKERAEKRAQTTGRKVPYKVIENTHKLAPRTLEAIKDELDSYQVYDNRDGLKLMAANDFIAFLKQGQNYPNNTNKRDTSN